MSDKLTQDVQSIVDGIFQQKEEVAMRKQTEDALNKSATKITELATSLEAKDEELSGFTTKIEELESTVSELSDAKKELEENLEKAASDFEAEKGDLTKRAETAEKDLEDMKKDQLAKARFEELKNEGVAAADEKAVEDQVAKIREMEDEDFKAYRVERVELRKSIVAELEASPKEKTAEELAAEAAAAAEEGLSEEEKAAKEAKEEAARIKAEEEAAAASDSPIEPMKAMAALLNMEAAPSTDMLTKYSELGKEMAKKFEKETKSE
jgi:DNA repair exonuclease SbcCD ATPase subunit